MLENESRHQCLIYEGAPSLQLPALIAMVRRKLDEGYRCLYLNSLPMIAGVRSYLVAAGIDVGAEVERGRLILSSESHASGEEGFDAEWMLKGLEDALDQALKDGFKGLWATGDMTWEFGSKRDFSKLLEYERGLEKVFQRRRELSGICQYHKDTLPLEVPPLALLTHRTSFVNETLSRINVEYREHA